MPSCQKEAPLLSQVMGCSDGGRLHCLHTLSWIIFTFLCSGLIPLALTSLAVDERQERLHR